MCFTPTFNLPQYTETTVIRQLVPLIKSDYIFIYTGDSSLQITDEAIERMLQIAEMSGAAMLYSDYYKMQGGDRVGHPTLEYQPGSVRDDFDFGPLLLLRSS